MVRWIAAVALVACAGGKEPGGKDDVRGTIDGCLVVAPETVTDVVTDIDETLTTSDGEWLQQLADPTHDPAMRPDANTLMNAWYDRGYRVIYVTARGAALGLSDGTSAQDATEGWLDAHGFPVTDGGVYLADGAGVSGDFAVEYKAGVIAELEAAGHDVVWAYGNAITDIEAYQQAEIPDDHIFLVGLHAGELGVEPIPDADAYTAHLPFVDSAPCGH